MRSLHPLILAFLLAPAALSQQPTPAPQPSIEPHADIAVDGKPFAFRFERRVNFDEVSDCIMVLPDGQYRREHTEEGPIVGKQIIHPKERYYSYIYEGQLNGAELASLAAIINRPEFRALREPDRLRSSNEFLFAIVLRSGEAAQKFRLGEANDYKPNDLALKPFFAWWKAMEKRKGDLSKNAGSSGCRLPARITFESTSTAESPTAPSTSLEK